MATTIIRSERDIGKLRKKMRKQREVVPKELRAALKRSTLILEAEVVKRTPVGVGDGPQGHVRSSIFSEVREGGNEGIVATASEHAEPVEHGSKPHWPPKGALRRWVEVKLGSSLRGEFGEVFEEDIDQVEFLIRRNISIHGTPAHHMFKKGWNASKARINRLMKTAFKKAVRKASGKG